LGTFRKPKVQLSLSELPYLSNPVPVDNCKFSFLVSRLYCQMLTYIFWQPGTASILWEKSDIVIAVLVNSPFQKFHKIFLCTSNLDKFFQRFARAFLANVLYNYAMSVIADDFKPLFPIDRRKWSPLRLQNWLGNVGKKNFKAW